MPGADSGGTLSLEFVWRYFRKWFTEELLVRVFVKLSTITGHIPSTQIPKMTMVTYAVVKRAIDKPVFGENVRHTPERLI